MADGAEYRGRTVEDAVRQAEAQLGVQRADLEIEIVTAGRTGVFGIGAESARIIARQRAAIVPTSEDNEVEVIETAPAAPEPVLVTAPGQISDTDDSHEHTALAAVEGADLLTEAAEVLSQLLRSMGFDAEVSVRNQQDPMMLAITGENLGVLIGRRGDNLAALQFMVNLILSKNRRQWPRIVIDVENYRERREQSLQSLADRIAYRVSRNARPFTLEAMPAGDRRVIHVTLRDRPDIETYSIGEGAARRVVIAPKRASQPSRAR